MRQPVEWSWAAASTAFLIHNAEELLFGLPDWATANPQVGWIATTMPEQRFATAVILLSMIVVALAVIGTLQPLSWTRFVLRLFAGIMLLNAASHIGLSLLAGSIMPGLWTALVLLLPVMGRIAVRPLPIPHAPSIGGHAP